MTSIARTARRSPPRIPTLPDWTRRWALAAARGVVAAARALQDWRERREARRLLARWTDAQLKDIGVSRGDVDRAVSGGFDAYRRG
ncbi:DUF1127 domain-containing protein [Alsobacter sp. SYSU M60028]|uniref:DUF1127 domain-containing protein n=1 Tax=Alsobacter ponti TaxID=2962936 RepID=A0ABT1L843_9HYPH|nr:DUF1127 domain-containing protein [Alsobacter ponti]MCP8937612.1 DUF1127 domain-containing protein [Alsobacter ponti]